MAEYTTVRVTRAVKDRLKGAQTANNPTYNDVIEHLLITAESDDSDSTNSETVNDSTNSETGITCHHCQYQWDYGGSMARPTCPSCGGKTQVDQ